MSILDKDYSDDMKQVLHEAKLQRIRKNMRAHSIVENASLPSRKKEVLHKKIDASKMLAAGIAGLSAPMVLKKVVGTPMTPLGVLLSYLSVPVVARQVMEMAKGGKEDLFTPVLRRGNYD